MTGRDTGMKEERGVFKVGHWFGQKFCEWCGLKDPWRQQWFTLLFWGAAILVVCSSKYVPIRAHVISNRLETFNFIEERQDNKIVRSYITKDSRVYHAESENILWKDIITWSIILSTSIFILVRSRNKKREVIVK